MGFYDERETAEQYVKMAAGYDGRQLVEVLRLHLPGGARVLELGMGPGVDFQLLGQHYCVTGSDSSQYFLDRFLRTHPDADLLNIDAVCIDTDRRFDCIYSNKVLHHLTIEDLATSVARQKDALNDPGLILHSFWLGQGIEEHCGLRFTYHSVESLSEIFNEVFSTVDVTLYTEIEADDSLYVLASR